MIGQVRFSPRLQIIERSKFSSVFGLRATFLVTIETRENCLARWLLLPVGGTGNTPVPSQTTDAEQSAQ